MIAEELRLQVAHLQVLSYLIRARVPEVAQVIANGGRRPAPKARAEGAQENFGLFRPGFHKKPSKMPNIFWGYAPEPLAQ